MDAEPFNRTPCDGSMQRASQLASGQITPIDGAHEIAWHATGDCYDFLNEREVVGAMAGFWQLAND